MQPEAFSDTCFIAEYNFHTPRAYFQWKTFFGTYSAATLLTFAARAAQLLGKQLLKHFKLPSSAWLKLEFSARSSGCNKLQRPTKCSGEHGEERAAPGTGTAAASAERAAPAVSHGCCSPLSFPELRPVPGDSSHPWAPEGHAVPTHAPAFIVSLARRLIALILNTHD